MGKIVENRYEFMVLVEAKMCNPNGDPDMGNLPRQDSETGCGYITDVAFKRRIRNYVNDGYGTEQEKEILMQSGVSLNRKIAESVFKVNNIDRATKDFSNTKVSESACQNFWSCSFNRIERRANQGSSSAWDGHECRSCRYSGYYNYKNGVC